MQPSFSQELRVYLINIFLPKWVFVWSYEILLSFGIFIVSNRIGRDVFEVNSRDISGVYSLFWVWFTITLAVLGNYTFGFILRKIRPKLDTIFFSFSVLLLVVLSYFVYPVFEEFLRFN